MSTPHTPTSSHPGRATGTRVNAAMPTERQLSLRTAWRGTLQDASPHTERPAVDAREAAMWAIAVASVGRQS